MIVICKLDYVFLECFPGNAFVAKFCGWSWRRNWDRFVGFALHKIMEPEPVMRWYTLLAELINFRIHFSLGNSELNFITLVNTFNLCRLSEVTSYWLG